MRSIFESIQSNNSEQAIELSDKYAAQMYFVWE